MAALPSFVQLMATLGLSDRTTPQQAENAPSTTPQDLPCSETKVSPSRSRSSPSLREAVARQFTSRYSPYSPSVSCHQRKGSHSSISSLSDVDTSPIDPIFTIPRRTIPLRIRKHRHKVSRSDSSCDITGDTPISTYVRRKTPGSSPVTPNFDSGYESSASHQRPFSIPTLPSVLLTNSANSEPNSPTFDCDGEMAKDQDYYRFILQRTGTRISAAPGTRKRTHLSKTHLPS